MTTETQEKDTMRPEHDAFREQRKSALWWLRRSTDEFDTLDRLEDILPSFVRRRYRINSVSRRDSGAGAPQGTLSIRPEQDVEDGDLRAADALHADVNKLFDFLLSKVSSPPDVEHESPKRGVVAYNGQITYEFTIVGLRGFEGGLDVLVGGLPVGSACRIIKTVTGTRVVEDVEYEMVCDDDVIPAKDAKELGQ